jgi:hypothetical protein
MDIRALMVLFHVEVLTERVQGTSLIFNIKEKNSLFD